MDDVQKHNIWATINFWKMPSLYEDVYPCLLWNFAPLATEYGNSKFIDDFIHSLKISR
jgi:hypothetical protein